MEKSPGRKPRSPLLEKGRVTAHTASSFTLYEPLIHACIDWLPIRPTFHYARLPEISCSIALLLRKFFLLRPNVLAGNLPHQPAHRATWEAQSPIPGGHSM